MALLADTDFPWVIVAMMFIAFFRWLMDRIKEASRGPEEVVFEEPDEDEAEPLGPPPAPSREPEPPPFSRSPSAPSRLPPPVPVPDPADEFRRLLETMRGGPPQVESRPPAAPPTPPRLPARPAVPVSAPPPRRASVPELFPTTRSAPSNRRAMVLSPQVVRDGIILREILGPPAALRGDDPRGS